MFKKMLLTVLMLGLIVGPVTTAFARADKTDAPVVFAHGWLGFDDFLGIHYWGDDYGTFVGDPCDGLFETSCNAEIDRHQQAFAVAVNPFASSEQRGLENADQVESYMASVGATHINYVGHSQGGLDIRKAAKVLAQRKGYRVVNVLISISSPHRGSPVAKQILDSGDTGIGQFLELLADYIGAPLIYGDIGHFEESQKTFYWDDYDPDDGVITGAKAFNLKYGIDNAYVGHYASVMTADEEDLNPILSLISLVAPEPIDADGWCGAANEDCDGDGSGGAGDGDPYDVDDDGLIGINSQQMGYRLHYYHGWFCDKVFVDGSMGYVGDINHPSQLQSTSRNSVLNEDHLDVIGIGVIPYLIPDDFDEKGFYGALIDYIANNE